MKRLLLSTAIFMLSLAIGYPAFAKNPKNPPTDPTKQTIGGLSCSAGQVPKFNQDSRIWECAADNDALGNLACAEDEIAKYDSTVSDWVCAADEQGSASSAPQFIVKDAEGDQFGDVLFPAGDSATIGFNITTIGKRITVRVSALNTDITSGIYVSTQIGKAGSYHKKDDCSDDWYPASQFHPSPVFLSGIDSVFVTARGDVVTGRTVYDIVEPAGTSSLETFEYTERFKGGCISIVPTQLDVYPGVSVVASDVFREFPAPYTMAVKE